MPAITLTATSLKRAQHEGRLRSSCGSSAQLCGEPPFGSFLEFGLFRDLQGILQTPIAWYRHLLMLDDIKKTPWAAANKLRDNMDVCEYKHLVLGPSEAKAIAPALA